MTACELRDAAVGAEPATKLVYPDVVDRKHESRGVAERPRPQREQIIAGFHGAADGGAVGGRCGRNDDSGIDDRRTFCWNLLVRVSQVAGERTLRPVRACHPDV